MAAEKKIELSGEIIPGWAGIFFMWIFNVLFLLNAWNCIVDVFPILMAKLENEMNNQLISDS